MIHLKGGRIIDPAHNRDSIGDLYIQDGKVAPFDPNAVYRIIDVRGKVVMAGGIDVHSHIGGAGVNAARLLLPDTGGEREPLPGQAFAGVCYPAPETGRLYAQMGYTTVLEPAMPIHGALRTHLELADIPYIDRAALVVLGNEDILLRLLRDKTSGGLLNDYVAWAVQQTRALGVSVVNAGGAMAFRQNVRTFGLDDIVPHYGLSSREIFTALQRAVSELGIPHPLHLHANNLGVPGNIETLAETIAAAQGLPLHLAHVQFYSYGLTENGDVASAAARLAALIDANPNITADVGQVMFGQTVTVSSDVLHQFAGQNLASPKKWMLWDAESNGGGVIPYNYRDTVDISVLQWAIGLELLLLINDPWRIFVTTDHPNGAPFTSYPKLIHLLMDRQERARFIERLPAKALETSLAGELTREYSLYEIAILTRAAAARLLGMPDRGHLGIGATADVAVYTEQPDKTAMFSRADYVFKNGVMVVKNGEVLEPRSGQTLMVKPQFDARLNSYTGAYYGENFGVRPETFAVPASFAGHPAALFKELQCRV